jgi:hypothetical protein
MPRLIGKVVLRNDYRIYSDAEADYKVVHQDRRGAEYSQFVASAVAEYVRRKSRGRSVTVAETQRLLERAPKRLQVPYDFGFKLQFYAQAVLLVLVALRQASYKKVGQRFEYTVHPVSRLGRQGSQKGARSLS